MALGRKIEGSWKTHLPKIALISYLVLSAVFIAFTVFNMFKIGVYQAGYNKAAYDISTQSLLPAACQSGVGLPTTDGKGTTLINVTCLQQPAAAADSSGLPPETPVK